MKRAIAIVTILFSASLAYAEEESPKVRQARSENELEKEAEFTDQKCGGKLAVKIEWEGFTGDEQWKNKSVSGYCEAPLGALRNFCEGKNAKEYISKKIKTVVCKAAKDKSGWKVELKGDVLEWHVSPDSVNNDAYAKNQILRKL